jgi:hypothetical protein
MLISVLFPNTARTLGTIYYLLAAKHLDWLAKSSGQLEKLSLMNLWR